jgi:hypothetical protein
MFFDIFKDKPKPSNVVQFPGWADVPPPPKVEQPKESNSDALNTDAYYTVGVNEHGYTVFKTGNCSLTMNSEAVVAMIEDLAHSIRRQYDVEITKID